MHLFADINLQTQSHASDVADVADVSGRIQTHLALKMKTSIAYTWTLLEPHPPPLVLLPIDHRIGSPRASKSIGRPCWNDSVRACAMYAAWSASRGVAGTAVCELCSDHASSYLALVGSAGSATCSPSFILRLCTHSMMVHSRYLTTPDIGPAHSGCPSWC